MRAPPPEMDRADEEIARNRTQEQRDDSRWRKNARLARKAAKTADVATLAYIIAEICDEIDLREKGQKK